MWCDEDFEAALDSSEQSGGEALAAVVDEVAHVQAAHQVGELAFADVGVDGGTHGRDKVLEVLPCDVRVVVE